MRRRKSSLERFEPTMVNESVSQAPASDAQRRDERLFESIVAKQLGEPALSRYRAGTYVNDPISGPATAENTNRPYASLAKEKGSTKNLVFTALVALYSAMWPSSNFPPGTKLCARRVGQLVYMYPSTWWRFGDRFEGDMGAEVRLAQLVQHDMFVMRCLQHLSKTWRPNDPRQEVIRMDAALRQSGLCPIMGTYPAYDTTKSPPVLKAKTAFSGVSYNTSMLIGLAVGPVSGPPKKDPNQVVDAERETLTHEYCHKFAASVPGGAEHNAIFFITYADVLTRLGVAKLITPPLNKQVYELVNFDKTRDAIALAKTYGKWDPDSAEELEAVLQAVNLTRQLTVVDGIKPGQMIGRIRYNAFLKQGRENWLAAFPDQDRLFDGTWNYAASGYVNEGDDTDLFPNTRQTPYIGFKARYLHNGTRYVFNQVEVGDLGKQLGYRGFDPVLGYVAWPEDPALAAWVDAQSKPGPYLGPFVGFQWVDARERYEPWADDPKLRRELTALKPLDLTKLKPDDDPAWRQAAL